LRLGHQTADWLQNQPAAWDRLRASLQLEDRELDTWRDMAGRLANTPERGLIEEFPGYFALDDFDLAALEPRSAALPVLLGLERVGRTQVVKQADVVLLCHLLQHEFDRDTIATNFAYYEPRCDHGSSLSPSMYALVAARIGQLDRAREHLAHAAHMDLNDRMGNSAQGIHLGACGGLWQAIVFGAAGLQLTSDGLGFDPHLLPEWRALSFSVMYHGSRIDVTLKPPGDPCEFLVSGGDGAWIELAGTGRRFAEPGQRLHLSTTRSES
jgi:kojibiose phosphorylase